jgi:2-isopropylmalate synthase
MNKVLIYDTTLRDGTQSEDFQVSVPEKLMLAELLDDFGVAYIEGGWPGSNPRDEAFFREARSLKLRHARLAAFGATRRAKMSCDEDPSIQALVSAETPVVTIFGKASRYQSTAALGITPEKNLELVYDSVRYLKERVDEVIFDAEHFFDGARADEEYSMAVLKAAAEAGADFLVLCDTNGGSLPSEVSKLTERVRAAYDTALGIHTHNDAGLAVANSLVAVEAGAIMIQGTVNGYGERCGNANLVSIIPNLELKMGLRCVPDGRLSRLNQLSRTVDEVSNYVPSASQPYVGRRAFSHKGGVHINAVMKDPKTYEHVEPEKVGNRRRILASDLSGYSTIIFKAREFGIDLDPNDPWTRQVLERIKALEYQGYQFEGAEASLLLLMHEARGSRQRYFSFEKATVTTEMGVDDKDATVPGSSTADVTLQIAGKVAQCSKEGNGPVHALSSACREIVEEAYPEAVGVRLIDYKVRILSKGMGFASMVRVLIRATDGKDVWGTVGVSTSVVEASRSAIVDAFDFKLMKVGAKPLQQKAVG